MKKRGFIAKSILLCMFLTVFTLNASAQKVTLSFQDESFEKVLSAIKKQTKLSLVYSEQLVDLNRKVNINVSAVEVEDAMKQLLAGTNIGFEIKNKKLYLIEKNSDETKVATTKSIKINGLVTDEKGEAIIGASIVVKGTTIGTISDINGKFILNSDGNAILKVTFIGYLAKEVSVNSLQEIKITLTEDNKTLDEVVVVGYGTQKKSNLTTSIAKIDDRNLRNRSIVSVGEALAGQLSGVRAQNTTGIPGADLSIKIRGINTINGNSSPLYVIDGVPRDNMTDLNSNDIASIQVLKDASATSIYGSRGANGVILIETKQGTGSTAISVDAYYGVQDPVKMMDFMNGDEWVAYQIFARNEAYIRQGKSMSDPMSSRPASLQIPSSWTDGSRPYVDWQKEITQRAPIQSYQVSASSKTDKGSIYISGGLLRQDGIIKNTFYNRLNFRINSILNVGDKLKLGLNIAPTYSNQADQNTQGKETIIHHALMQSPIIQLNEATVDFGYPTEFATIYTNPVERLKAMTDNTEKGKINSSIWAEYQIMKGLYFKSQYSYDYITELYEYFYPAIERSTIPSGNSYMSRWNDWTLQNTLNYDFIIAKNHSFNILLGQSIDEHKSFNLSATATGFPNSLIRTMNVATTPTRAYSYKDRNTTASYFSRVSYSYKDKYLLNASIRRDGSSRFGANNKWGTFPSASAGWKLNEESFMKEINWLSLFKVRASWGKAGNDRIGNYDYMSLLKVDNTAWNNAIQVGLAPNNIGNDNLKWESTTTKDFGLDVSFLKNRIQLNLDYYINNTTDLLFNSPVPYSTGFSSFRTNLGEIQNNGWEIDLNTRNLVGAFKWSSSLNLSANQNKVIDMGGVQQFITGNWDAQFITRVGGPVSQFYVYRTDGLLMPTDFSSTNSALVPIMTGQVPGNVKYIDQPTIDSDGDGVLDKADGVINSSDLVPYGTNLPDLIFGFTNRFEFKNFELSVLLQGQIGGEICWLGQRQMDAGTQNLNQLSRWIHSWKPDYEAIYGAGQNPLIGIPAGVDMSWDGVTENRLSGKNDNNSDLRIYDASFLKIKNITLSYTFPKNILGKGLVKAAKTYFSVDNLALFDKYPGVTTESNSFGNETTQAGVDYTTYPLSKRYTLGLNITF
jgi:TonB-linked SusC/RagA family outer membrane protein